MRIVSVTSPCGTTSGFSLIELSIVLVIVGLLTGGIVAGQSLIRASELRSISTDYTRFATAIQAFRNQYSALPGDLNNATAYWGAAHATPSTCINTASTNGTTCNGDGDGEVFNASESFRSWQHLANAGLIEGSYTGVKGSAGAYRHDRGINAPGSKINRVTFGFYFVNHAGDGAHFQWDYGNIISVGIPTSTYGGAPEDAFLTPEEAWGIDTKLDDGKPGTGKIFAIHGGGAGINNAASCSNATSITSYNADYRLTRKDLKCALYMGANQ